MAKEQDTGLGLTEFLGSKDEAPKQEVEAKPPVEPKESKPAEKSIEAKAEAAKPAGLDKDPKKVKEPVKDAKEAQPAGPNWDDDNNPFKKEATELKEKVKQFDKRYRDTHSNWNSLNQQNQELQRQLQVLSKKFDGTYDPQRDEPPPPDPQAIRTWGTIEGKAQASYAAACRTHGQDEVMRALERYADVFGQDRGVQERILQSDDPVQGAMEAVRAYEFAQTYGSDPTQILAKARQEWEASELPKLEARLRAELSSKQPEPRGIGKIQGSSGAMDSKVAKDNAGRPKPLSSIFGN